MFMQRLAQAVAAFRHGDYEKQGKTREKPRRRRLNPNPGPFIPARGAARISDSCPLNRGTKSAPGASNNSNAILVDIGPVNK
jgi:hypothetical protein